MDTRTGHRLSRRQANALEPGGGAWFAQLSELTLELPAGLARSIATVARRVRRRQGRDGIALTTMSDEWLREFEAGGRARDDVSR
jgi:hypothetical protein